MKPSSGVFDRDWPKYIWLKLFRWLSITLFFQLSLRKARRHWLQEVWF